MKVPLVAIVEDDELLLSATASLIRSLGLMSAPFRSALDFLEAPQEAVGCIISDLHMPGMTGLELQETLNAQGSQIPFILVTAYATEQTRSRALANGAHCFLEKPCTADALVECLERIFGPLDG
ncbi:response regulator transcription factor [Sphingomonas faeni]|uniref:response regulator transcription factor n=1 Tax=Sphingomonas faeni TaxID=185950 RepID=UPI0027D804D7|nr:response regulator [Sphingomonas faeni]